MEFDRNTLLLIGAAVIVMVLLVVTMIGCRRCKKVEGFASDSEESDSTEKEAEDIITKLLTPKEREMFTKLKGNALDDKEIDRLIGSGALTPELMEKFLDILESKVMKNK